MTEVQWNSCTDPQTMLDFLWDRRILSMRKVRLLFCACSRRNRDILEQTEYRQAVEVAEQFADTAVDEVALRQAYEQARDTFWGGHPVVRAETFPLRR
jgi:hypothetical protein